MGREQGVGSGGGVVRVAGIVPENVGSQRRAKSARVTATPGRRQAEYFPSTGRKGSSRQKRRQARYGGREEAGRKAGRHRQVGKRQQAFPHRQAGSGNGGRQSACVRAKQKKKKQKKSAQKETKARARARNGNPYRHIQGIGIIQAHMMKR